MNISEKVLYNSQFSFSILIILQTIKSKAVKHLARQMNARCYAAKKTQGPISLLTHARTILSNLHHARAWLLPRTFPLLIAGALMSLLIPPSAICFRGVKVPCAKLLARPRRSRIIASASSRVTVGLRAGLPGLAGSVVMGVRSGGFASGMRVVVDMVWNVWTMVVFSSSLRVGLLGL